MELFSLYLSNLWQLINLISIYLLFGLLFAGVLKQIIPENFIKKQLGTNKSSSIIKAALFGIPLPLCSCSVIPFATALQKSGASRSSLQTFLISTPITGADSIIATWGTFGGIFTVYRVISSIVISMIAGFLTLIFVKEQRVLFTSKKPENYSLLLLDINEKKSIVNKEHFLKRVYNYAFKTLYKDIVKPLFIGVLFAALITTFLPSHLPSFLQNSPALSYLAMLFISLPIYVCATASIPLGISFVLLGFSPGAALVFLTAGPASNMITMLVVKKLLGLKSLGIYLGSLIIGSVLFGALLDIFFQSEISDFVQDVYHEEHITLLHILSTITLLLIGFQLLTQKYFKNTKIQKSNCS